MTTEFTHDTAVFALKVKKAELATITNTSSVAPELRQAYAKSGTLLQVGLIDAAARVLVDAFAQDRNRSRDSVRVPWKVKKWSEVRDPVCEMVRLVFSVRDAPLTFDMFRNLQLARENLRGNPNSEEIWKNVSLCIRKNLEALIADTKRCRDEAVANPTADLELVSIVSGHSIERIASDRFSVERFVDTVVSSVVESRFAGTNVASQKIVYDFVGTILGTLEAHHLRRPLAQLVRKVKYYFQYLLFSNIEEYVMDSEKTQKFNRIARDLKENRTAFQEEVTVAEKALSVLCALLTTNRNTAEWKNTWEVIELTTKIVTEFLSEDNDKHRPLLVATYKVLAQVFHSVDNSTFHALCLVRAASAGRNSTDKAAASELATAAVLAVLSAPVVSESRSMFGASEVAFRHSQTCARAFGMMFAPSRSTLDAELRNSGVVAMAHPSVAKLRDLMIGNRTVELSQHVSSMEHDMPFGLDGYIFNIRRAAMAMQLSDLARSVDSVSLDKIHRAAGGTADYDRAYLETVEPTLLDPSLDLSVLIDQEGRAATFTAASDHRMQRAFETLAVAAAPSLAAAKRQPLAVNIADIEFESVRNVAFAALDAARLAEEDRREREQARLEEERRLQVIQQRIDEEKRRQDREKQKQLEELRKKYVVAEQQERHRLLIKRLMEKHKGLVIGESVALLNHNSFMENLTKALTEFQRKQDYFKNGDVRAADHFERACRERDIPKRKEIAEAMASQLEAEREARWQNSLEQHRAEYNEKVSLKQRLLKLREQAETFEARQKERSAPKVTKRDEQEELLRAEKARLAAAAAPAASPPPAASAASAPVPNAAAGENLPPPPTSGAKWGSKRVAAASGS